MLAKYSVKRPYTVVVAVILVLILGVISFINLETDLLPSFDLPYVLVMTPYPGASPEEVEMVVTKPLEQVMATVSNIKEINSVSSENSSVVILEFNNDTNMDSATIEISGLLDLVKAAWPDGIGSPMQMRLNPDMLPIMVAAVDVQDLDMIQVSQRVEEEVIPKLESIPGLASISATGLLEERVQILLETDKIASLNKDLLKKVDQELSQAEDKLEEAQEEMAEGLAKLDAEEKNQKQKLEQGKKAIQLGKLKLDEAKTELLAGEKELLAAETELRNKRIELVAQENSLKAILSLLDELEKNLPSTGVPGLDAQDDLRAALQAFLDNLPAEIKLAMGPALQALEERLQESEDMTAMDLQGLIANLKAELSQLALLLSQGLKEIDQGLAMLEEKKLELAEGKAFLDQQIDELGNKEQELALGGLVLTLEMGKARDKLAEGEATLAEKMAEFEEARDLAFKEASLDGVITREMVSTILAAQNFSMPAGSLTDQGQELLVKVGDKFQDQAAMENLLLFDTGDQGIGPIYLKDLAQVTIMDNSDESYARVNGNAAVILTFQKQSNFSTSQVTGAIRDRAEELAGDLEGLNFTPLMDQGIYIDIVVDSVLKNVIYGGLLAILILLLFLKDIRPTFIIAVSIPISLVFAIAMMYFTGVSINIISLA
ncbi:MAG TPA: efflux RND transporter permease subunit, partial [Clostridia bacterium]|nr:efflux RND transporter permease subunit [Clostridia bacterium]